MEINAIIRVTTRYYEDHSYVDYDFVWEGPADGILGISGELMLMSDRNVLIRPDVPKVGDEITFGCFDLVIIKHQLFPVEVYYCIRKEDVPETQ